MNKFTLVVIMAAAFTAVVQSSIIKRSTIENPCQRGTTANSVGGTSRWSLEQQINSTLTEARTAITMCEQLKEALFQKNYITSTERADLDHLPLNATGLPTEHTDTNMNQANVFTRVLRHNTLNITLIYKMLQRVVVSGRLLTIDSELRNVMSSMITVKCRVTLTSEARESTFTDQEMIIEDEMILVDYDLYVSAEEAMNSEPVPEDTKHVVCLVYSLARYMQTLMAVLENALQMERQ